MKTKILLIGLAAVIMGALTLLMSDGLTYLVSFLMALMVMGTIYSNRRIVMKVARWAKANPKKTQWIIAAAHLSLLALGVISGKNLKELGYEFSLFTPFVFGCIMLLGFWLSPFILKPKTIAIPKEVDRHRWGYLCIALSSLIMAAFFGNRMADIYPNSPITYVIERIDQSIFPDHTAPYIDLNELVPQQEELSRSKLNLTGGSSALSILAVTPASVLGIIAPSFVTPGKNFKGAIKAKKKAERKAKRKFRKTLRKALAGGSCAGAVLLIILLVITTCAGICLVIGGAMAIGGGSAGIGLLAILAGGVTTWGSVTGISKVSKWCKGD